MQHVIRKGAAANSSRLFGLLNNDELALTFRWTLYLTRHLNHSKSFGACSRVMASDFAVTGKR